MARECRIEIRTEQVRHPVWTVTCDGDGCGKHGDEDGRVIDGDPDTEEFIHEVIVCLDQDECVSTKVRRDYCDTCLTGPWEAISAAMGIDADAIGTIGWPDD